MAELPSEKLKELAAYFAERGDVAFAFLFGSYAAGTATARSDADVGVYFTPASQHLEWAADVDYKQENEVWGAVGRVLGTEIDLVVLNRARPTLAFEIVRVGTPLAINNRALYLRFFSRISFEAIDYRQFAEDYWKIAARSASLTSADRTRLIKLLTFLAEETAYGKRFSNLTQTAYMSDRDQTERRLVERWAQNMVNCAIDIAKVLLASEHLTVPDTYRDVLAHLRRLEGFDAKTAERLGGFAELRNILAHEYLDMRFAEIRKFIDEAEPLSRALADFARGFLEKKK